MLKSLFLSFLALFFFGLLPVIGFGSIYIYYDIISVYYPNAKEFSLWLLFIAGFILWGTCIGIADECYKGITFTKDHK